MTQDLDVLDENDLRDLILQAFARLAIKESMSIIDLVDELREELVGLQEEVGEAAGAD